MAYGKSLEPKKKCKGKVWYNPDGTPLRRKVPKEHTTKKARRKARLERSKNVKDFQEKIKDEAIASVKKAAE